MPKYRITYHKTVYSGPGEIDSVQTFNFQAKNATKAREVRNKFVRDNELVKKDTILEFVWSLD